MNKNKPMVLCLSLLSLLGMAGCGGRVVDGKKEDPTKANLTVGTLDAGIGGEWLVNAANRFNELYKDSTDFQEGRTGVNVTVTANRSYDGIYLKNNPWNKDIMITEAIDYYNLSKSGKVMDITDVFKADLGAYGESGKTIESKIDQSYLDFLNLDGGYYGVPFYDSFYGFVYDIDLWKTDGLYISKNGTFTKNENDFSLGCDGIAGTEDDGLPSTYQEFGSLINKLKTDYGKAFVTASDETEYMANFLFNVWAMEEGKDGMRLQYNLSSKDTNGIKATKLIKEFNADGSVKSYEDPLEITYDNAYMLQKSESKYNALRFLKDCILSSDNNWEMKTKNTDAQSYFVRSVEDTPCPMILEGSWFENEAKGVIASQQKKGMRHNYAIMPIPFARADEVGKKAQTRLSLSASYAMISSDCQNVKLAKEFMKFLHTDAEMKHFTMDTGMSRPLNYNLTDDEFNSLSTYSQSIFNIKKTQKIFYPYSHNRIAVNNANDFGFFHWAWNSDIDGTSYVNPWVYMRSDTVPADKRNALVYFNGCYDHFQKNWKTFNR